MMVRWSGEVQVNVSGMSNLNLSLTLVDVKLVILKMSSLEPLEVLTLGP